jgi:hypothetical protein
MTAVVSRAATLVALTLVVTAVTMIPAGSAARLAPTGSTAPRAKAARVLVLCAKKQTGQLRLVRKARSCRKSERVVRWGSRGPAGTRGRDGRDGRDGVGATGPAGPPGASGAAGAAGVGGLGLLTARLTGYSGLTSPAFGAPSGETAVSANEDLVETLSPARDVVISRLAVQTTSAPGTGNTVTVTLRDDGSDTSVSCTVIDAATSCTNTGSSAVVSAGSTLSFGVTASPGVLSASVLIGAEAGSAP